MKKLGKMILCIALMATVCYCLLLVPGTGMAFGQTTSGDEAFDIWNSFASNWSDRSTKTIDSDANKTVSEAAYAIEEYLLDEGYKSIKTLKDGFHVTNSLTDEFTFTYDYKQYFSHNVIGVKKAQAEQSSGIVIIGAHYDNYAGYEDLLGKSIGGDGAFDNASGIAAMLYLAEYYKDVPLDFDLIFVAYGAGNQGFSGSAHFIDSLTVNQRDSILLAINLDSIICGEELYYYTDEVERSYDRLIEASAYEAGVSIEGAPQDKKTTLTLDSDGFPYVHLGLSSDNYNYVTRNINSVSFFGGYWAGVSGFEESSTIGNIGGTSLDTVDSVLELYGEPAVKERFRVVIDTTVNLLAKQNFALIMSNATDEVNYKNMVNDNLMTTLAWCARVFVVLAAILVFVLCAKKDKKDGSPIDTDEIFNDNNNDSGNNNSSGNIFDDFDV